VTDPVKTQFGYHLILVSEHKEKPLAEAKREIEQKLRPDVMKKYIDGIRVQTPITIEEAYFGKPEPPPATIQLQPAGAPKPAPAPTSAPAPTKPPASAPAPAK